jgi:hypothetical protein
MMPAHMSSATITATTGEFVVGRSGGCCGIVVTPRSDERLFLTMFYPIGTG